MCSDKIHQAGGVAAPVGGQILSEVLPYLELQEDKENEEEKIQEVEVPDLRGKTVKEAKAIIKDLGIQMEINESNEESQENINNEVISNQIPFPGIKINSSSRIYVDL